MKLNELFNAVLKESFEDPKGYDLNLQENVKLNELFNAPLKIIWHKEIYKRHFCDVKSWLGVFDTPNGEKYEINIDEGYYNEGSWELSFSSTKQKLGNKMSVTGTGNAFLVYSTILDGIKYFIKEENPKKITFEAFTDKQDQIYKTFIKKYSSDISALGYSIIYGQKTYSVILLKNKNLEESAKLNESFNKPLLVRWRENNGCFFDTPNGEKYKIYFDENDDNEWELSFESVNQKIEKRMDVTGTGNAFLVYSTLFDAITYFIKEKKPNKITFEAYSLKQNHMYKIFIKRYSSDISALGYSIINGHKNYSFVLLKN